MERPFTDPRSLLNPETREPLTCSHCDQEEDSPAPVHGEGCALGVLVEEGVLLLGDVLRARNIHI